MQLWRYDQVVWGEMLCSNHRCGRPAEVIFEAEPWCCDCADLVFDRSVAISEMDQAQVDQLPPLFDI